MVLRKQNHRLSFDLNQGAADLKKYVFINIRKQIRQEMESISAS